MDKYLDELRVLRSIAEGEDAELFGTASENAKRIDRAIRQLRAELTAAQKSLHTVWGWASNSGEMVSQDIRGECKDYFDAHPEETKK